MDGSATVVLNKSDSQAIDHVITSTGLFSTSILIGDGGIVFGSNDGHP